MQPHVNGNFFDLVGAVTASVTFWNFWTLRDQFTMVVSEDVGFRTGANPGPGNGFGPLPANQLTLAFNDAKFDWTGWGITWNPYVTWFYQWDNFGQAAQGSGQTQACFTCGPNRYTFFVGIDPTLSLSKWGLPLTLKAPTYVTVGPANFWTGGQTDTSCLWRRPGD